MNRRLQLALAALVSGAVLVFLLLAIRATPAWSGAAATEAGVEAANSVPSLTDALFGAQVIPFEVLGVLLTAVMFGALVIARPLTVTGDEESSLVHPNLSMPSAPAEAAPAAAATEPEGSA